MADWYYIGHYGQLGPLTREQIDELIDGGVISRETYVWQTGMAEWLPADKVVELRSTFVATQPVATPPPPPNVSTATAPQPPPFNPVMPSYYPTPQHAFSPAYAPMRSDRNRIVAGILQLLIPGVGRIYLGYAAYGVLQLFFTMCFGIGYIWSFIDGIVILTGGVKLDGYGRQLSD